MLLRAYALHGRALPQGGCRGAALLTRGCTHQWLSYYTVPLQAPPAHYQGGAPRRDTCAVYGTGCNGNPPALAHGSEEHHSYCPYGSRHIQGSATHTFPSASLPTYLHLHHRACRAQLLRYLATLHHRDGAGEEESFYDIQRAASADAL